MTCDFFLWCVFSVGLACPLSPGLPLWTCPLFLSPSQMALCYLLSLPTDTSSSMFLHHSGPDRRCWAMRTPLVNHTTPFFHSPRCRCVTFIPLSDFNTSFFTSPQHFLFLFGGSRKPACVSLSVGTPRMCSPRLEFPLYFFPLS